MKILHTSDWHLGHTLYNYDRTEEQTLMLLQMVQMVREEQPDVFLLCGDVYHTPQPSATVQTMFTNALMEIHGANPGMTIVITAGNHDSGTRHEIFRTPWRSLKVHTIGNMDATQTDDLVIGIPGKGYVIAVPYVHERNMPEGFFQQMLDKVAAKNTDGLPVIMMAHTTVSGCDFTGHDNASEYTVGGIDTFPLPEMGTGYDYLALGHIHHAQFVHGGEHKVRYSGTPLPVSFDENYPHSVSIVEISRHNDTPVLREREILPYRPLVTLPAKGSATWEEAKRLLADFPDDMEAYIRLNVQVDEFLPVEANGEASLLTKDKKCRFCHILTSRRKSTSTETRMMSVQEFKTEEPIDIARRYAEDIGIVFDDDMKAIFKETEMLLREEDRK